MKNSKIKRVLSRDTQTTQNRRDVNKIRFKKNIIQYYHIVYLSNETILRAKILRRCHDDSLTRYFDVKKTIALIQKKNF